MPLASIPISVQWSNRQHWFSSFSYIFWDLKGSASGYVNRDEKERILLQLRFIHEHMQLPFDNDEERNIVYFRSMSDDQVQHAFEAARAAGNAVSPLIFGDAPVHRHVQHMFDHRATLDAREKILGPMPLSLSSASFSIGTVGSWLMQCATDAGLHNEYRIAKSIFQMHTIFDRQFASSLNDFDALTDDVFTAIRDNMLAYNEVQIDAFVMDALNSRRDSEPAVLYRRMRRVGYLC